jgi:hypothetical protein
MRSLWSFVRCVQPSYANFESNSTVLQVRSIFASIGSADVASLPSTVASVLRKFQKLPGEIQLMILGCTEPSLGMSMLTVRLNVLPLLREKRYLEFCERKDQLQFGKTMYVRYAEIRGQRYLSGISNTNDWDSTEVLSIPDNLDLIVLSLDDLGIRDISCVTPGSSLKTVKAQWYQFERLSQNSENTALITVNVRHPG